MRIATHLTMVILHPDARIPTDLRNPNIDIVSYSDISMHLSVYLSTYPSTINAKCKSQYTLVYTYIYIYV